MTYSVPQKQLGVLAILLSIWTAGVAAGDFSGRVVRVHDGDTLTVLVDRTQYRVRLTEMDAPELGQAFGKRAGKEARVDDRGKDRYGRTLGRFTCGGVDANSEQVRRGMAWVYVR